MQQPATAKLLLKGYSLSEGVKALGICLKTYRNMIKGNSDKLDKMIGDLDVNLYFVAPIKSISKDEFKSMYPKECSDES